MALGVIALGHGGGVPGPIPGTPVVASGNTNFALVHDFECQGDGSVITLSHLDVQVILSDHKYDLIDCGPETALRLCGVPIMPVTQNLRTVFITHCHDDHSGGLKSLAYRTKFIDGITPILVYPVELGDLLRNQMVELSYASPKPGVHGVDAFYRRIELPDLCAVRVGSEYDVSCFPVNHNCFMQRWQESRDPFPAFGYTIRTKNGWAVTFSGDTAFPLPLENFIQSDFVIHDVQFYNDGSKKDHVHCPYALLRDHVPPEHRHKVLLTHTGHELPPEVKEDGFAGLFKQGHMLVLR